jgi:uncharacterized protein (TIGR02001 family)
MSSMKWLFAALALLVGGVADAGVSATVTVSSDYDFRGISLTARNPEIAGSLDYAHDSGAYLGAWASNVDFGDCCDENVEVDYYAGYGLGSEGGPTWSIYGVWYSYPGADVNGENIDYPEINAGVAWNWFTGKVWYSWDYNSTGDAGFYTEAAGTFPLPMEFSVTAHAGYSFGDYWSNIDSEYYDWSIGVGRSFGHFSVALKYIDGSDYDDLDDTAPGDTSVDHDVFSTDGKVFLSVATTFPWGE